MRRITAGLLASIVVVGLSFAMSSPTPASAAPAHCAPVPRSGEEQIAVEVDFQGQAGSPGGVSKVCVPVSQRSSGAIVLSARASQLGLPAPRWQNGLLCAIDGYPETGCASQTGTGNYRYWSYWLGSGSGWAYANVGPTGHRADPNVVEGWSFIAGSSEGAAAPPRGTSVASQICTTTPPTTQKPTATTTTTPGMTGATIPGTTAPVTVAGGPTTTTSTVPGATTTTVPGQTTTTSLAGATTSTGVPKAALRVQDTASVKTGGSIARPRKSGNLPQILGIAAVLVIVVGLFGAAAVRSRRQATP